MNDKRHFEARLPNLFENLEGRDVGLSLQLKMLEFINSVNQKLNCGKKKEALTRQDDQVLYNTRY